MVLYEIGARGRPRLAFTDANGAKWCAGSDNGCPPLCRGSHSLVAVVPAGTNRWRPSPCRGASGGVVRVHRGTCDAVRKQAADEGRSL